MIYAHVLTGISLSYRQIERQSGRSVVPTNMPSSLLQVHFHGFQHNTVIQGTSFFPARVGWRCWLLGRTFLGVIGKRLRLESEYRVIVPLNLFDQKGRYPQVPIWWTGIGCRDWRCVKSDGLVFQGVKRFIFDFLLSEGIACQCHETILGNRNIRDPGKVPGFPVL